MNNLDKYCPKCKTMRKVELWPRCRTRKDGLGSWCKLCMADYRSVNKNRLNQHRRDWYRKDPKKYKENASQKWREEGRDKYYGLTPGTISSMMESQHGECANPSCYKDITQERQAMVDHDHSCCPVLPGCGKCVRGLLCRGCNWTLGRFDDDREKVMGLIRYLEIYTETASMEEC